MSKKTTWFGLGMLTGVAAVFFIFWLPFVFGSGKGGIRVGSDNISSISNKGSKEGGIPGGIADISIADQFVIITEGTDTVAEGGRNLNENYQYRIRKSPLQRSISINTKELYATGDLLNKMMWQQLVIIVEDLAKRLEPEAWVCGGTKNTCSRGIAVGIWDDDQTWQCLGLNGGSSARCKQVKKINGKCWFPSSSWCEIGTVIDKNETTNSVTWKCKGNNGGSTVECRFDGLKGTVQPGRCRDESGTKIVCPK